MKNDDNNNSNSQSHTHTYTPTLISFSLPFTSINHGLCKFISNYNQPKITTISLSMFTFAPVSLFISRCQYTLYIFIYVYIYSSNHTNQNSLCFCLFMLRKYRMYTSVQFISIINMLYKSLSRSLSHSVCVCPSYVPFNLNIDI